MSWRACALRPTFVGSLQLTYIHFDNGTQPNLVIDTHIQQLLRTLPTAPKSSITTSNCTDNNPQSLFYINQPKNTQKMYTPQQEHAKQRLYSKIKGRLSTFWLCPLCYYTTGNSREKGKNDNLASLKVHPGIFQWRPCQLRFLSNAKNILNPSWSAWNSIGSLSFLLWI